MFFLRLCASHSFLFLCLFLVGCGGSWQARSLQTEAGGLGIAPSQNLEQGPGARAQATDFPSQNKWGVVQPFGSQGERMAYEFADGYRIGAGDRLAIKVLDQPDLSGEYLVDGSGRLAFPLVERVSVGGLTAEEIERALRAGLKKGFLRNPSVSVQIVGLRPFYILGEVTQSGAFPYHSGMTVQNAIALAGGYSQRAHQGDVILTRKTPNGTKSYKVPVTTALYPGDTVYIRERWF